MRINRRGGVQRSDRGAVAILTAVLIPVLILLTALAVDLGRWYVEAARVQKAADAAALGGVTYMPNNYSSAQTTAGDVSADNGYGDSGTSACTAASPASGTKCVSTFKTGVVSELGVTVSSTITNVFGSVFGNSTTTIARTAVADYQGPAIMGSPCNTFGNEPDGTSVAPPSSSTIPGTLLGGYATCDKTTNPPNFWAVVQGPQTNKSNGDRYSNATCDSGTDGCSGTTNSEFDKYGYIYVVRVGESAKNHLVTVQLYDPAFVATTADCTSLPTSGIANGMNPYVPTGAATRYARSANQYCPGDADPSGNNVAMVTSFALRNKTLTYNPLLAPVISGCVKQFGAQTSAPTAAQLTQSNGSYRPHLAMVFHQWVNLCTFTPTEAGDYYMQVRTSASTAGASAESGGGSNTLVWDNGPNATSDNTTQTTGSGSNKFGIRAFVGSASSQPDALNADVSVASYQEMPMFQNVASGSTFNLLQVKPDAAGKQFYFDLFDVGDGSTGTVTVKPPLDSGLANSALTGCKYKETLAATSYNDANLGGLCSFSTSNGNKHVISMIVPIPASYSCNASSAGGCWFRVTVNWNSSPTDTTTWSAAIGGNALRLVQ